MTWRSAAGAGTRATADRTAATITVSIRQNAMSERRRFTDRVRHGEAEETGKENSTIRECRGELLSAAKQFRSSWPDDYRGSFCRFPG